MLLLFVAGVAVAGTQLPIPGVTEVTETVMNSDVGDLLREVRDGASERLRG